VEEKIMANESPERTVVFVLGVVFSITGILTNIVVLGAALYDRVYGSELFSSNVANTLFLGMVMGVLGYLMGARKLGLASIAIAVFATLIGALLEQ
jgi:hypothetical protein